MPLSEFEDGVPQNVEGRFYVTGQCLDCDLCRETAPTVFARKAEFGWSYVARQPETEEELEQVVEALEGCCTEAIRADGDLFDWKAYPSQADTTPLPPDSKTCGCCRPKPWWKFW